MLTYLFVMKHIFPNQTYWKKEAEDYIPFPDLTTDELIDHLAHCTKLLLNKQFEKLSGFELENVCLRLMLKNPKRYAAAVYLPYRNYAYRVKNISSSQRVHRRAFMSLLESMEKGATGTHQ